MFRTEQNSTAFHMHQSTQPEALRIGYLVNHYPKVSHTFIRREILELERQGVEVVRYAMRGFDESIVDQADAAERQRTSYLLENGIWKLTSGVVCMAMQRPRRFIRALIAVCQLSRHADRPFPYHLLYFAEACCLAVWIHRDKVRHLHAHFGTNSTEVALLAGLLSAVPYSFTAHGPEEFDKAGALHLADKIRKAAFVVAVSAFGKSQLFRAVPHSEWDKVHVVHCALDLSTFPTSDTWLAEPNRIVCVGRLCEQKGQLLLLDAARELVAQGVNFELVLAGDGEMRPVIEEHVRRYGLASVVRITGWLGGEQIRQEILQATALVLPSFAEGLPVALMEAMALERPVLTTWVAGIPELVTHGETGWLFPPGDVQALVDALAELFGTPRDRLVEMGQLGRRKIQARHEISIEVRKLLTCVAASSRRGSVHG